MAHDIKHLTIRKPLKGLLALACVLLCVASGFGARATMSSVANLGYIFLHPMFKTVPWESTLNRLDLSVFPDTLLSTAVKSIDFSEGAEHTIAVFSTASNDLFIMPVLHEKLIAPCFDNALTFDDPRKVAGLSLSSAKPLHVVRDSLYARDSVRVVIPSATSPLQVLVATIRSSNATVTRIDTIALAQRRTGQQILGVSGAPDSVTGQDRGVWITGTNGLVRHIPYANHRFGAEATRDLGETTVSVTHTNGTFAVTTQGRIFRRNPADTFYTFVSTASGTLQRVYPQGAIGDNGLFKEFANGSWRTDKTLGTASFRYANFIRRPGGLGVELLDSTWAYSAYTYRDTSTRIAATSPASLATNINGAPYAYNVSQSLDLTVMLDDPDSNFSDYTLSIGSGSSKVNLKNDGKYSIAPLNDSAACHIGSLKMRSGRVRLLLAGGQLTVQHDCALGALDPTCLSCYWKNYDFQFVGPLRSDTIRLQAGQHLLRIAITGHVTTNRSAATTSDIRLFAIRFPSGSRCRLLLPPGQERYPKAIVIHDIEGRLLAHAAVGPGQHSLDLPQGGTSGTLIVTCKMNDGSTIRTMAQIVQR